MRLPGILTIVVSLLLPGFVLGEGIMETESIRGKLMKRIVEGQKGEALPDMFEGIIGRVTDSESIWIRIEKKTAFRKWTYKLSKESLNIPRQEIRLWLTYVSPKLSISKGKKYNEWFRKKVAYEMGKAFYGRRVRVNYKYLKNIYRIEGMVWTGDININEWMIKNGWSFYLLSDTPPAEHQALVKAEQYAKEHQLGLWKSSVQKSK